MKFAAAAQGRKAKAAPAAEPPGPPELTGVEKEAEEAEKLYLSRDLKRSREAYLKVLQQQAERPLHAKAYYGLARIAILQRDPELAEKLFAKVLEYQPAAEVKAWSLVYLGRLADASGEMEQAKQRFREALAVPDASPGARKAAEKALEEKKK